MGWKKKRPYVKIQPTHFKTEYKLNNSLAESGIHMKCGRVSYELQTLGDGNAWLTTVLLELAIGGEQGKRHLSSC